MKLQSSPMTLRLGSRVLRVERSGSDLVGSRVSLSHGRKGIPLSYLWIIKSGLGGIHMRFFATSNHASNAVDVSMSHRTGSSMPSGLQVVAYSSHKHSTPCSRLICWTRTVSKASSLYRRLFLGPQGITCEWKLPIASTHLFASFSSTTPETPTTLSVYTTTSRPNYRRQTSAGQQEYSLS